MKIYKSIFLLIGIFFACSGCTSQVEINRHAKLSRELTELSRKESVLKHRRDKAEQELSNAKNKLQSAKEARGEYLREKSVQYHINNKRTE